MRDIFIGPLGGKTCQDTTTTLTSDRSDDSTLDALLATERIPAYRLALQGNY